MRAPRIARYSRSFFVGRRNVIQQLLPAGLAAAPFVLLTGCSAGGGVRLFTPCLACLVAVVLLLQSTYANADFVASLLPPLAGRNLDRKSVV